MLLTRLGLLCALLIIADSGWACRVPRREQLVDPDIQIEMATDIALAEVISATPRYDHPGNVGYQFIVVKRLIGPNEQSFSISGWPPSSSSNTTFDNHKDEAFWQTGGGRVTIDTNCAIHPDFIVGKTYLVFRDLPMTFRSFEEIEKIDGRSADVDKWFAYVQARVRK
jgi:hypothetical protein